MRYLPLTQTERDKILSLCGVKDFDQLIEQVPEKLHIEGLLDLDAPLSEGQIIEHLAELSAKNSAGSMKSFLGQGVYQHSWPRVIDQIINRGEFLTAYTPYQPEISQGTLQVIFEYQSMMADLMGADISNASLYDGATSVVEGILMAARLQNLKSGRVLVSEGAYDRYRKVIESYLEPLGYTIDIWRADPKTFTSTQATLPAISGANSEPIVAVVLQSPNTWGLIEDFNQATASAATLKTKSIAVVTHAHSTTLFAAPGHCGVDIVTGEAQTLGIPAGYGGPHLGIICCKKQDVRQMPGRLVGATVDVNNQRAFCITLATREQHIRREKATSNICSNQNLMLVRACMYLTLMGPEGLRKVATLSRNLAWQARQKFTQALSQKAPEVKMLAGEILNEICLLAPNKSALWIDEYLSNAEKAGMIAGVKTTVPIESDFAHGLVLAFTENHKASDIDALINALPTSTH